ncbi:MAG TPA: Kae1-associated serine/threonine protein kinase [Thermoplasmatales archaeon]|nr:Kae1-associated serine/threonine protein kinase [Thermoplasmatales archaeon]
MERVIYRGAEAEIILSRYLGREVVKKRRIPKSYRLKELDFRLRSSRTREEAKLIMESRKAGVPVPIVYDVDLLNCTLTMEFVKGERVKELLSRVSKEERRDICVEIGKNIAKLHNRGIIHGDLTTSNMIFLKRIYFIDFGLGSFSKEIEDRGVDLHLLLEAFKSAHSEHEDMFSYVLEGYREKYDEDFREIKRKLDEISKRGRYIKWR